MTPQEIANTPGLGSGGFDIMGSSLEGFDFSKIDPSFFQGLGDYVNSKKTPAEKIYEQLKGQSSNLGTVKSFETGAAGSREGGFGSTDAVMKDMARILADAGLTSIEQFGRGPLKDPVRVQPELTEEARQVGLTSRGRPAYEYVSVPTGRWYITQQSYDWEGSPSGSTNTFLSPEEVASYGLAGKGEPQTVMMNQGRTGFINKATGEELTAKLPGFGGQGWGGTSAGDGQTVYDVNFDPTTGLPIFYNRQTHGRDRYAGLLKAAAIGTAIFAPQIGAALLPAGSSAAAALAVGSAVSGLIGSGGNIEQGIKSGLAAYLGGQAGSWAGQASNSALVGNIASNMTRAAILGGDMSQALVSSLVQAAPAEIIKHFPNFSELPRAAQEAAVAATVDLMKSGGDNLGTIAIKGATDGLTDYTLKQIPGYDGLRKGQQDVVRERVSNVVRGESLTNEVLQGAIQFGAEAVRYQADTDRAVKAGWKTLEEQQAATSLYGSKVTPELYADKQNTTEEEAKKIAQSILGREPDEFEYMQLVGLTERDAAASSDLAAIRYDESTFDSNELAQAYKAKYGVEPTKEFLESPEAFDMLGRSDVQGRRAVNEFYTKDKNETTKDEALEFLKSAGLREKDITPAQLASVFGKPESGVKEYLTSIGDLQRETFNGNDYEEQSEAQAAAIKAGQTSYTWGGSMYTLLPKDQEEKLKTDVAAGKNIGVKPKNYFAQVPGQTLDEQLKAAGNPEEYAYMQGDTIVVVGKRMAVPDYNDIEAWDAFKAEKKALGGDNFQSFLTEKFSILEQAMKGAPRDSLANVFANAAVFGYGKIAQVAEAFSRTGEAAGIPQAERGTNIAKQVQSWSKKLVDQGIQNAESAVLANVAAVTKESIAAEKGVKPSDISTAELYAKKTAALFKQIPNNPLGVSLFLAGEGIQEIPLLAASGGVGNVLKNVASKSIQLSAAVGTNVGLNGMEGFGGNYGEVKEYLQKQGVPSSQIEALAIKSGFEAMGASMLTAYVGDRALIKSFMGDLAKDSFGKVVTTNSAREWFLGNLEGSLQNMSAQIGKYGSIKSEDEWLNAGIMEGFAQKGIAAGVLTADALGRVVAKDYDGKPVTYKQIIDGEKTFDPKTIDKSFNYGTGVNLGDAIGYHSKFLTNPDITPDEYFYTAQTFRQNGMNDFTPEEIGSIVSGAGELTPQQISAIALPYAQERVVTKEEAQQMMRDLGYTNMTDAEAMSLAGQISEASAREKVKQYVDPRQVTRVEAEDFFKSIPGYKPTEADITSFVRQGANVNQETVKSEIDPYVDSRMVDEEEVKAAYKELGLDEPTQADVTKLVGQYNQDLLSGRAKENLGTAQFNVTTAQQAAVEKEMEELRKETTTAIGGKGTTPTEADSVTALKIATRRLPFDAKYDWNGDGLVTSADARNLGLAAQGMPTSSPAKEGSFWTQPTGLYKEIGGVQTDVDALEKLIGTPGGKDTAGTGIIGQLEAMGATDVQIQNLIGNPATKTEPATGLYKTAEDAAVRGENAASAVQIALGKVIGAPSVKDDPATPNVNEAAAATGLYGQIEAGNIASQAAIKDVKDLIGTPGKDNVLGTGIMGQLEAMGLADADIKKVIGEPANGKLPATGLYKAAEDAAVRGESAASAVQKQLGAAIGAPSVKDDPNTPNINEEAAATGLYGQVEANKIASQTAIKDVKDLIGSPGGKDVKGTGIIGQLEAMGLVDSQIQNLIGSPADGKVAPTGLYKAAEDAAVRGEDAAAAVQKELSGIIGKPSVKDDPATPNVNEAVAATGLYGQMEASQAQMNEQYNALTAAQKVTADALVAQGETLSEAIATAQEQTQTQITNLGTEVNNRITELVQQGQTYQQATQQAFAEVNAKNQELSGLIGTQGRTANQSDIDALADMLGGKRSMDLNYDVTGDKQITQADIDFLTGVVSGKNTDWTAPQQSPWAATGLYGQIQANELQRQKDLAAADAQRLADQQAAAEAGRRNAIRAKAGQGQQQLRSIQQQLPQALKAAEQVSTPLYGTMEYFDPFGDPFAERKMRMASSTNPADTTKIAAGGYIDDLLAGDMTADDLLNLLR